MRTIFVFFLVGVLISCSKDSEVENIYSVPEEFRLDMIQTISSSGILPAFQITTLAKIGCSDQELRTEYFRKSNNAYIQIIGVEILNNCIAGTDNVKAIISDKFPEGVYNLRIGVKDQVENLGTFTAGSDKYTISLHKSPNIMLGHHSVKKLPENIWWGSIYFDEKENSSFSATLLEYIKSNSTTWPDHQSGHYGLFSIDEGGSIVIEEYKNKPGYTGFCVKQNAQENEFIKNLSSLVSTLPGIKVFLASDKKVLINI
jgi:hypothetical protein